MRTHKPIADILSALLPAALIATSTPAVAGVVNGQQVADSTVVYLGVVPAAITRGHPGEKPGTLMHGGLRSNSIHDIHVMVAVFDQSTGSRITDAKVDARFAGRGRTWSVPLQPMTVNGALTYGGYTSMGTDMDVTIFVNVLRPSHLRRPHPVTVRFDYSHD